MASIAIQNETEYTLTEEMAEQIRRDAQEYFGEAVRSIRVQYGIERHAFNARTGEVRYAFSPNDFGLVDTTTAFPDTYYHPADIPTIDDDTEPEEELTSATFEDVEPDEEEPRETSLESLEEGMEEDEEEEIPELEDQLEDTEDEDNFIYDDDDYDR
jgi:hypothetical protein